MSKVWFILLDGFDLFEASAAMHTFVLANDVLRLAKRSASYKVRAFSAGATPVRSNGEVTLKTNALPRELTRPLDRLVVVGGGGSADGLSRTSTCQKRLIGWMAQQQPRIRRLASLGADAFVVVQAAIRLAPADAPWRDGHPIISSSGMELALRMIAHDEGLHVALQVAQRLAPSPDHIEAPFRFRSSLTSDLPGDNRAVALNRWIAQHLRQTLSNERLAGHLAMSPRTFARFYQRATGFTPARAVEQIRLEHACQAMETTLLPFKAIASRSGFSSEEVMRRAFLRVLKVSPSAYRRLFFGQV